MKSHRLGILRFAGVEVVTVFDKNGPSSRESFRRFDDGMYRNKDITSRHDNIVKAVIQAKKSWGLHVKMWSEGIADWCFTPEEILGTFTDAGIEVPDSLLTEFHNAVNKAKMKRYDTL